MLYEEIKIGSVYEFKKVITRNDGLIYAKLTGDHNKLHLDRHFGNVSKFGDNIVHGMFTAGLFSTLVGMYCPGENSLYLGQTLSFRNPIYYDVEFLVRGEIINKSDSLKMVTIKTEIIKDGKVAIYGEAKVGILN